MKKNLRRRDFLKKAGIAGAAATAIGAAAVTSNFSSKASKNSFNSKTDISSKIASNSSVVIFLTSKEPSGKDCATVFFSSFLLIPDSRFPIITVPDSP